MAGLRSQCNNFYTTTKLVTPWSIGPCIEVTSIADVPLKDQNAQLIA